MQTAGVEMRKLIRPLCIMEWTEHTVYRILQSGMEACYG